MDARDAERSASTPFLGPDADPYLSRTGRQGMAVGLFALPFVSTRDILHVFHILRC